ncbi:L,D-transpeptidase family protein [Caenispirillum bisanense]|uniref:L,D-transpeptidase family protein n=1 Tax=Caenispirillum bisanense TaxID=414052 RepID=UPI0031CFE810
MISRRSFTALSLAAAATTGAGLPALPAFAARQPEERLVTTYVVKKGDTFHEIAKAKGLGFLELRAANPDVEPWMPEPGSEIVIPSIHIAPRAMDKGILLSLGGMRLFHFRGNGQVDSYAVGIGAEGLETPLGTTTVVSKRKDPTWTPTANIRKRKPYLPASIGPGPDNPLGNRAMYLGWPAYLIHGTNLPDGIGRRTSSGCIRMYPWDVEAIYEKVDVGTRVMSVDDRYSVAFDSGRLWLEVHPTLTGWNLLEDREELPPSILSQDIINAIVAAAPEDVTVDWEAAERVVREQRGYPVAIGHGSTMTTALR